jgi:glucuronate isomerase
MKTDSLKNLNAYIDTLEILVGFPIQSFENYLQALKNRHDYFADQGCRLSDHGLEQLYAEDFSAHSLEKIFQKIRKKYELSPPEILEFKSALLYNFSLWDHEKGWVQQFHLGALRNNNSRAYQTIGPDTGYDSIGDFPQAQALSKFLNRMDSTNHLAKTILYNLSPGDNALFASMCGNFNDGTLPGKIQFGSAWWFLDQKDGMEDQLNVLSRLGLLSRMVGMLTDSRSFLSYPRHEYFRRILCNLFARDVENGELPQDIPWIGKIAQDISYYNAQSYFGF